MKILTISDRVDPVLYEHFDASRWSDIDLVISCGDVPPEYLDFLLTSMKRPVLYVRGNHDGAYARDAYAGCFNLDKDAWSSDGITIVGFEGSLQYNCGEVQYSESEMRRRIRKATRRLGKVDVVVTHAPPRGCGDRPDPCHRGFECFRELVERLNPRFFVHGHSHLYGLQHRTESLNGTLAVNAFGHYVIHV